MNKGVKLHAIKRLCPGGTKETYIAAVKILRMIYGKRIIIAENYINRKSGMEH